LRGKAKEQSELEGVSMKIEESGTAGTYEKKPDQKFPAQLK
jgi:hypothetical protein